MSQKILLIEDDKDISEMVDSLLSREGYTVACAYDGEMAVDIAGTEPFDLLILDLMLPKKDGLDCLKEIRMDSVVPVLIISAKGSDLDKALGLGFGADDYLSKPFSTMELLARVKALLRRAGYQKVQDATKEVMHMAGLKIMPATYSVEKNGQPIQLTLKEFRILQMLAGHPENIFTKEEIYQRVWEEVYYGDANVINVHISRLREKIEDDPSAPVFVKTIWGIGYKWGGNDAH